MPRHRRRVLLLAAASGFAGRSALAQGGAAGWRPNRPVTLVVPFAAGSGTDSVARILASLIEPELGQRVVVDNRAGGNGSIAAVHVAHAAPDGHTLFVTTNTTHSANPALMKRLDYDPIADFTPIGRIGNYIFMLVVGAGVPARSVAELVALARARPGAISYASGNSTGIVGGAVVARMGGVEMLHVPYRSTPPAITDVIAGRVSAMILDLTAGLPHVRAGRLRALAVTTRERSALLPDIPSIHEAGLPGYDLTSWCGLFGPARLPSEIVASLNGALRRVWDRPETKARLAELGFEAFGSTPEELDAFVRQELRRWGEMARLAGIEPE